MASGEMASPCAWLCHYWLWGVKTPLSSTILQSDRRRLFGYCFSLILFLSFPNATYSLRHLSKNVAHRFTEFRGNNAGCCKDSEGDRGRGLPGRGLPRPRAALTVMGAYCLSLPGAANDARDGFLRQNMMPRRLRAHRERGKEKGRVTQRGGGELRDITHLLVWIESGKSKFLRVLVAMQQSKWAVNFRPRERGWREKCLDEN